MTTTFRPTCGFTVRPGVPTLGTGGQADCPAPPPPPGVAPEVLCMCCHPVTSKFRERQHTTFQKKGSEITQGHYITLWTKSQGSVPGGRRHLVAGDRQGSLRGGPQGVNSFRRVSQLTSRDGSADDDFPEEAGFFLVPSSWNGMVALLWRSELM